MHLQRECLINTHSPANLSMARAKYLTVSGNFQQKIAEGFGSPSAAAQLEGRNSPSK